MDNWIVELAVSGAIRLPVPTIELKPLKGEDRPFRTLVELRNEPHGVHISLKVKSDNKEGANDAAVYFAGRAIDVLCLEIDQPLHISTAGPQFRESTEHVKRVVDRRMWRISFRNGRVFGRDRSTFSRALSWFRKGQISEDPIDKFLAFWNSIEVVGSKYARQSKKNKKGSINKACDCFDQIWGSVKHWKVIPGKSEWVNEFCKRRHEIAHGLIPLVELSSIREISETVPMLHQLAREFLRDWQRSRQTKEFK